MMLRFSAMGFWRGLAATAVILTATISAALMVWIAIEIAFLQPLMQSDMMDRIASAPGEYLLRILGAVALYAVITAAFHIKR